MIEELFPLFSNILFFFLWLFLILLHFSEGEGSSWAECWSWGLWLWFVQGTKVKLQFSGKRLFILIETGDFFLNCERILLIKLILLVNIQHVWSLRRSCWLNSWNSIKQVLLDSWESLSWFLFNKLRLSIRSVSKSCRWRRLCLFLLCPCVHQTILLHDKVSKVRGVHVRVINFIISCSKGGDVL